MQNMKMTLEVSPEDLLVIQMGIAQVLGRCDYKIEKWQDKDEDSLANLMKYIERKATALGTLSTILVACGIPLEDVQQAIAER
jgi:hypothetical protein